MSTQEEKEMDDFIRKMVVDTGLEKPSPDLKSSIMKGLKKKYSGVVYRSLISKKGWGLMFISLAAYIAFAFYNPFGVESIGVDLFPWDLSGLFGQSSTVTLSAIGIFGFMMVIQVLLLKRMLDQDFKK
ncbi:hypothetical protein E7Z59_14440 [Robertkochia marina]|uniref:Uncharacterized protein n=1 Tax=Robertkochia marina TaxID=1227945 RepID=A0A4S3LXI7_9FLAO|nr:hypothetical protein [Robertkochia marina]THD65782.1 hypothetical protein E7Z59_14440 [Robertkochia marina]TRZ46534.1 hypothetical protein D3A96_02910 [Robertkochia marina]